MPASLGQLAALISGRLCGDEHLEIDGAATLRDAGPRNIALLDCVDQAHLLQRTEAGAAVVPEGLTDVPLPVIHVSDVHAAFAAIVTCFRPPRMPRRIGVSPAAFISESARLGYDVDVHPGATIGEGVQIGAGSIIHSGVRIMADCRIGENVVIYPNAVLYEDTVVGSHCIIHAGALIGPYGFGYSHVQGRHVLSAQLGYVEIGEHVEIGAGTTIDRGTYGPTMIGEGTKIDDQVMIAHNCKIGRHNLLCSQVGIAGSTSTGDYVVMAGQVGVRDHVHVGEGATLGAMSGVLNDVPGGSTMLGIPATPAKEQRIRQAMISRLPEMRKQLKDLTQAISTLQQMAGKLDADNQDKRVA